jgi:hypothetical protein
VCEGESIHSASETVNTVTFCIVQVCNKKLYLSVQVQEIKSTATQCLFCFVGASLKMHRAG